MPINSFLYPAPSTPTFAYNVANSVRLNAGDNPSGTVTQGTPTNVDKYTFSVWVKRADIGAGNSKIFSVQGSNANVEEKLEFNNDDIIWRQTESSEGNTNWERVTDRKFRDPSAWYHIVVAYDSSQGTAGNRCKMYINGVQETSFSGSSNPSSNLDSVTNTSGRALKFFALNSNTSSQNAGAYFTEMVYVDGQQLDPTSFGEFDSDSPNIWKPIDVSGLTFGNNGFYLDFEDSSALGNDVSGNNNDVTFSNLAATDQSTDTCTNNFATLNPLVPSGGGFQSNSSVFSEGNLKFLTNNSSSNYGMCFSSIGVNSGKWYIEAKLDNKGGEDVFGISAQNITSTANYIGGGAYSWGFYQNGTYYHNNNGSAYDNNSWSTNDILRLALDLDNNKLYFGLNATWQNSGNPESGATGTGAVSITDPSSTDIGFYFFGYGNVSNSANGTISFNFGSPSFAISSGNADANGFGNFEYSVPSGYFSLCTKNLAEFG